jgi:OOP family OmpA-OmpF porin
MKTRAGTALVLAIVCSGRIALAATPTLGPQLTLSLRGGILMPDSGTLPELDNGGMAAGSVGILPWPRFGFEATYAAAATSVTGGPDARVNHVGLDALLHVLPGRRLDPYVGGGWAQLEYDPDKGETQSLNGWEVMGGVLFQLVPHVALRFDARDVMVDQDADSKWLHNPILTGGLHVALGGQLRDSDGDGVPDRSDRCVDTPAGAHVDASGCPLDADADGVADGIDTCPDTPVGVRVDAKGCPLDSDGDGVFDGIDTCPDTPAGASVDAKGCSVDGDGDGVPDGVDRCPGTPTGARVDAAGCPLDSDGDGVFDGIDHCPDTGPGLRVDMEGCPIVVNEKETQLLDTGMLRLDNVQFETGKASLRPEAHAVLDEVGSILTQWPQLEIEIGGHTDSRGATQANLALSQKRAQAVLDYLQSKFPGLQPGQYTAVGYGESAPIADNATSDGRARNRRVEFKVLNREVLQKEMERRKPLRKPND